MTDPLDLDARLVALRHRCGSLPVVSVTSDTMIAILDEIARLRANQLPEGGEWGVYTGHYHGAVLWWEPCREPDTHQRRVWCGPVEPVTDGGSDHA